MKCVGTLEKPSRGVYIAGGWASARQYPESSRDGSRQEGRWYRGLGAHLFFRPPIEFKNLRLGCREIHLVESGNGLNASADDESLFIHQTHYKVYKDRAGEWRWTFYAANGRKVADSGEGYINKTDCLHGIQLVSTSGQSPVYDA